MNRHGILGFAGLTALVAIAGMPVLAAAPPKKPNIVLLFVDDLGWNEVKYKKNHFGMPQVDRLMADGMTFTDAYAASPTCSPSRASVVTGQHPARLRLVRHVPDSKDGRHTEPYHTDGRDPVKMPSRNWLPVEEPTLADALKPLGYRTAFVGKWHLGHEPYHPVKNGYDVQFGVSNCGHPRSYHAPYFGTIDDTYTDVPKGKYLTDQLTDDAVAYLEKQDGKEPFMMTLFYYSAHDPFDPDEAMTERLKQANPGRRVSPLASMLVSVDVSVGRIRETLKKKGLDSDTILFFLGDQGGKIPSPPMKGTKKGGQALYEGGARIPFIVVWPGVVTPGTTCAEPVVTTDVFPTMLGMAGGKTADYPKLDGLSLVPVLKGTGGLDRKAVVLYRSYEDQYAAVRSGKWKYIAYRRGKQELFDLEKDLSESRDLSSEMPEQVDGLKAVLRAFEKEMDVPGLVGR